MDRLANAQQAMERGDAVAAYGLLADADRSALDGPGLMLLAEVAYATGHFEATLHAIEDAHGASLAAGDRVAAAASAVRLAMHLIMDTGLMAPARAWAKKAERLLEGLGDTPVHAWLGLAKACERWLSGDFDGSWRAAADAIEAGRRHGIPGVVAFAQVAQGRCLIYDGRIAEGLELIDEAAGSLLTENIDPLTAGCLYCEMVCIWQGLARYDKAEEWTDAMERFCRDSAVGSVVGRCRVHRAEILRLRGEVDDAEREVLEACEQLRPYLRYEFGWPLTELGRIRLVRGDHIGAETAFLAAHEMGWDPHPGFALLRLEQGDLTAAKAAIRDALDHPMNVPSKELPPNTDLRRAPLLETFVEIAVAAGDLTEAREASEDLGRIASIYGGNALTAAAALAAGRVRLAEGDADGARSDLQDAVRSWSEIPAPFEAARARLVLADAQRQLGNDEIADLEMRSARSTLAQLRRPAEVTETDIDKSEFRREGDYWIVTFAGKSIHLKDMKGLRYLAHLLGAPGHEFNVVDLVALERSAAPAAAAYVDPELAPTYDTGSGELLDAKAKEMYRRRITEIEEDIAEARSFGDSGRVARAECEKEFLIRELSRAVGLGGRDRQAGATSERARAAVTRAIRNAMSKISAEHPMLGEHLERAVRTGTYCVYLPDTRSPVEWTV